MPCLFLDNSHGVDVTKDIRVQLGFVKGPKQTDVCEGVFDDPKIVQPFQFSWGLTPWLD